MENADSMIRKQHASMATREHPSLRGGKFEQNTAVSIRGLNHVYGEGETAKQVLFDNRLDLARGEIVIMTGPSGSGKTTLLTLIGALRTVQQGSIRVMGRELWGLDASQLVEVRRDIGFIFQAHNLFTSLTARQNVRMSLELKQTDSAAIDRSAEEILTAVGLAHRMHYKPQQLSGGQRQRVAIARALAVEPEIILADEPTSMLDVSVRIGILNLMRKLRDERGVSMLYITHDLASARYIADTTMVMCAGDLVEGGESIELMTAPHHPYTQLLLSAVPDARRTQTVRPPKRDATERNASRGTGERVTLSESHWALKVPESAA